NLEIRPFILEADLAGPGCERRIRLRAADEDHVAVAQQFVRRFEVLVYRNLALIAIEETALQLFGGVAIRAGIPHRAEYDHGRWQAAPNVIGEIAGATGRVDRIEVCAKLVEAHSVEERL